jgi:hypothetical protein
MDELTPAESDAPNRRERITRRKYYQKMNHETLPIQASLKWIRKIKKPLKEGKMMCERED